MERWTLALTLVIAAFLATACATPDSPMDVAAIPIATGRIILGDISRKSTEEVETYQQLADYLAADLGEFGIGVGEVKVAPDLETVAHWLESGEVDLYFDSPYPAMIVSDLSGSLPFLPRWESDDAECRTVIFTRADSGLASVSDLKGQVLGFGENNSTSGYFLPLTHLLAAGLNPVENPEGIVEAARNEVGYVFTEDDANTIQWVISGKVAAGAVDSHIFSEIPEEARAHLTILAETEPMAQLVIVARPGMHPAVVQAVQSLLTDWDEADERLAILKKLESTPQFDESRTELNTTMARLQELYDLARRY